ncbi:MAG: PrgI family protein [Patescibacteria group bacterium]
MANFQVPQFIEKKAKIIGPLTLEEFLYIAGAGGISLIAFYVFNFFLWLVISIVFVGAAIGLAFVKINGESAPKVLLAALNHLSKPKTYTWQRQMIEKSVDLGELEQIEELRKNMGLQEKLKSVALNIATGKIFSGKRTKNEVREYETVTFLTGEQRKAKRVDY